MRKILSILGCVLSWVMTGFTLSPAFAQGEKVVIAYASEPSPPYYLGQGSEIDAQAPGYVVELLNLVAKKLDIDLQFRRVPWTRALQELEMNRVDGLFDASYKPDREKIGVYPGPLGQPDAQKALYRRAYYLFATPKSFLNWDRQTLKDNIRPIGLKRGFAISDFLEKQKVNTEVFNDREQMYYALSAGRLAAIADLEEDGNLFLSQNGAKFSTIAKVEPALQVKPYYLMLSHGYVQKSPAQAQALWQEIQNQKGSPADIVLRKKYGL